MDDVQADYDELVDALLARHGGAERSQMMGMPCVKRGGKLALGFVRDEGALVFKLEDAEEREAALALEGAHLFDPSGRGGRSGSGSSSRPPTRPSGSGSATLPSAAEPVDEKSRSRHGPVTDTSLFPG